MLKYLDCAECAEINQFDQILQNEILNFIEKGKTHFLPKKYMQLSFYCNKYKLLL